MRSRVQSDAPKYIFSPPSFLPFLIIAYNRRLVDGGIQYEQTIGRIITLLALKARHTLKKGETVVLSWIVWNPFGIFLWLYLLNDFANQLICWVSFGEYMCLDAHSFLVLIKRPFSVQLHPNIFSSSNVAIRWQRRTYPFFFQKTRQLISLPKCIQHAHDASTKNDEWAAKGIFWLCSTRAIAPSFLIHSVGGRRTNRNDAPFFVRVP